MGRATLADLATHLGIDRRLGFDTRSLHAGHSPQTTAGTRAVPLSALSF